MKKTIVVLLLIMVVVLSGCEKELALDVPETIVANEDGSFLVEGTYTGPNGATFHIDHKKLQDIEDGDSFSYQMQLDKPGDGKVNVKVIKLSKQVSKDIVIDGSKFVAAAEKAKSEEETKNIEEEKEVLHDNPFFNIELHVADVKSGSGQVIGKRGYINYDSSLLEQLKNDPEVVSQFREFIQTTLGDTKYNWFNVFFEDGKALKTTGGFIEYIKPDDEGAVLEAISVMETLMFNEDEGVYKVLED